MPAPFSDFDRAMAHLLHRLGLPPLASPAQACRLDVGDGMPVYCADRAGTWLEMQACAGFLRHDPNGALRAALLALQARQPAGPLCSLAVNGDTNSVVIRIRLPLADVRPEGMIEALQALRAHAAAAAAILAGGAATPVRRPLSPLARSVITRGARVRS